MGVITRLAAELRDYRATHPDHGIIIGHGSGSFGHHYAARYHIHRGLAPTDNWLGFALTSGAALRLNRLVVDALLDAGVPALALQPSATLQCVGGSITAWHTEHIQHALHHRLVPVIHGDVAFDTVQGCAIVSTETLFTYLMQHSTLAPTRLILVGENAVYTADPRGDPNAQPIPLITRANIDNVLDCTGGSHAVDVTGGMRTKIELMWQLVQQSPGLEIVLVGAEPGEFASALAGKATTSGTRMRDT